VIGKNVGIDHWQSYQVDEKSFGVLDSSLGPGIAPDNLRWLTEIS